ncbi:MAG: site-specific integrase [Candidatus Cloacimonetes bacterium]|nr:site-specific integrase [Candidatus Cloacimonadota bacterium]
MANIKKYKLKNGKVSYKVRIRLNGKIVNKTFRTIGDARKFAIEQENEIESGKFGIFQDEMLVEDLLIKYTLEELPMKKSPTSYLAGFKFFREKIGHLRLKDITVALLHETRQNFIKENKVSFSTINRYYSYVSHCFTMAVQWEYLEVNPFLKVGKLKEPNGRVRFLSDEERERLLTECKKVDYLYIVVVLALTTGARKTEILSLSWKQIQFDKGFIILEDTKNGERRSLPLCTYAKEVLLDWKEKKVHETLVFNMKDCKRSWSTAVKNAEIEDFRFHDLRHCCASYLAMQGVPILAIADVLGHKTLKMVKRYAHLSNQYKSNLIEDLGIFLFPV